MGNDLRGLVVFDNTNATLASCGELQVILKDGTMIKGEAGPRLYRCSRPHEAHLS